MMNQSIIQLLQEWCDVAGGRNTVSTTTLHGRTMAMILQLQQHPQDVEHPHHSDWQLMMSMLAAWNRDQLPTEQYDDLIDHLVSYIDFGN